MPQVLAGEEMHNISEVYRIRTGRGEVLTNSFGSWSPNGSLTVSKTPIWHRRIDLRGHKFRYIDPGLPKRWYIGLNRVPQSFLLVQSSLHNRALGWLHEFTLFQGHVCRHLASAARHDELHLRTDPASRWGVGSTGEGRRVDRGYK